MPVLQTTAYGTVSGVLNETRAIVNDMMFSIAGEILTDIAPFTFLMLNRAAGYFENELINHGILTFKKETVLTPVLPIAVLDPGVQVNISDSGYFDGVANHATPFVPFDLMAPECLWERQTGTLENWVEMTELPDGLTSTVQTLRLRYWEWRQDQICMPGATQSEDIRLRYTSEVVNFSTPLDVILIRGSQSALASYLAYVFAESRGSAMADKFMAMGKDFTLQICRRNTRARQRQTITRQPYGGVHSFFK
jgi:hypothetical protein